MKFFCIDKISYSSNQDIVNGYRTLKFRHFGKIFIAKLKTPSSIRRSFNRQTKYVVNHNALCFGYLSNCTPTVRGVVLFEFPTRLLIMLLILNGATLASQSYIVGTLGAIAYYLVWLFLSSTDDTNDFQALMSMLKKLQ